MPYRTASPHYRIPLYTWNLDQSGQIEAVEKEAEGEESAERAQTLLKETAQRLRNSVVSFPEEPIGSGAKWMLSIPEFVSSGVKQSVVILYTLKSADENKLTLSTAVMADKPAQEVTDARGVTIALSAGKDYMQGEQTVHLDRVFPNSELEGEYCFGHDAFRRAACRPDSADEGAGCGAGCC